LAQIVALRRWRWLALIVAQSTRSDIEGLGSSDDWQLAPEVWIRVFCLSEIYTKGSLSLVILDWMGICLWHRVCLSLGVQGTPKAPRQNRL